MVFVIVKVKKVMWLWRGFYKVMVKRGLRSLDSWASVSMTMEELPLSACLFSLSKEVAMNKLKKLSWAPLHL